MKKISSCFRIFLSAAICAIAFLCTVPVQAAPTPNDPVEAAAGFIQSVKSQSPVILNYIGTGFKKSAIDTVCQGQPVSEEEKAQLLVMLDDPNSPLSQIVAQELFKREDIKGRLDMVDIDKFKATAKVNLNGNKAEVDNYLGGKIFLVKEADGWKLDPSYFGN